MPKNCSLCIQPENIKKRLLDLKIAGNSPRKIETILADEFNLELLKCQRIINAYFKNEGENDVGCALDGLVGIIQHSDQDHILEKAIKMVCAVLFCSSFFSEKDKRLFVQTIDEASQRYGWDFNKNMIN